jgi:anti-anti-sigma factor
MTTPLKASPLAVSLPERLPLERTTLAATITELEGGVLVRLEGDAGILGVEQLQMAFTQVIARRAVLAVLDFSHLKLMSSLAIGLLVRLWRDLSRWNGCVRIASCPPVIRQTLETAGVADFFGFRASVEEAMLAS